MKRLLDISVRVVRIVGAYKNLQILCGLLFLTSASCQVEPADGYTLQHAYDNFDWIVYWPYPLSPILGQFYNFSSNQFDDFNVMDTSFSPINIDPSGTKWYGFNFQPPIPHSWDYWEKAPGKPHYLHMITRSYGSNPGDQSQTPQYLATFTYDSQTQSCAQANYFGTGSAANIATNCHSPNSPKANIYAPCGTLNEACCSDEDGCDPGLRCVTDDGLGLCKGTAKTQCNPLASPSDCATNYTCKNGTCQFDCIQG
jgi:hypothetical protein